MANENHSDTGVFAGASAGAPESQDREGELSEQTPTVKKRAKARKATSKSSAEAAVEAVGQAAPDNATTGATPVEVLEAELSEVRKKADEHYDSLLRAQAELENVRRRTARDLDQAHKFALERFVMELLPVRDSMEMGIAAAAGQAPELAKVCEGMELTLRMFNAALEKFGVTDVNPENSRFDPEYHQAMSTQEIGGVEPGTVTTVVQKGFLLNGRLLRPAMVIVAK